MKSLNKKSKPVNNTPNPQKSPNSHSTTSSYYINILKQSNRFNSIKPTLTRNNPDNLSSPNSLPTKNITVQTPSSVSANKVLFPKNKFLNLTTGDGYPKDPQTTNYSIANGKESGPPLSSLERPLKTEGNLPTPNNLTLGSAVKFFKSNQKVVVTPRNLSQHNNNSTIETLRPSPTAAKGRILMNNSAYKFPLNSPKLGNNHSGKTLSIDNANNINSTTNINVGLSSAISKNKSFNHNNSGNSNIQRYNVTNDSIDHNDIKPFDTIGTGGLKEEEKCINHPHKKVKYLTMK